MAFLTAKEAIERIVNVFLENETVEVFIQSPAFTLRHMINAVSCEERGDDLYIECENDESFLIKFSGMKFFVEKNGEDLPNTYRLLYLSGVKIGITPIP